MTNTKLRKLIRETIEKNSKGKILYIHGFNSSPSKDGIKNIKCEYEIISPKINYKNKDAWKTLSDIIDSENIIGIIGHSFGGYLAYYLSNKYKIPALMFNAAFKDKDEFLPEIPKNVLALKPYRHQMAVIGEKDDVIKPKHQKEMFNSDNIYLEDIGHDIPKDMFKNYVEDFTNAL